MVAKRPMVAKKPVVAKKTSKAKASLASLAGKCLTALKKRGGARNLASPDGGLTSLVLLAIIARGTTVSAGREALARVKEAFVDWNELRVTRAGQIASYFDGIKNARDKARTMADVLTNIFEGTHNLTLSFLVSATAEEARDYLRGLAGLTDDMVAEIVLSGREYFHIAADTDVARVARRIGLIGKNTTAGGFDRDILDLLGEERTYQLTYLLKEHAETVCTVHAPHCDKCALTILCPPGLGKKKN